MYKNKQYTFVAFDAPIPQSGGGTRAFYLCKKVMSEAITHLFILSEPCKLHQDLEKQAHQLHFATKVKKKQSALVQKLKLLFIPWALPYHQVILQAQYYILKPTISSDNKFNRLLNTILRVWLYGYSWLLYKTLKPAPARTYERYEEFNSLKKQISNALSTTDMLWIEFTQTIYFFLTVKKTHPHLKVIVDAHNVEYIYHQRLAKNTRNTWHKKWHNLQAKAMQQLESKIGQIADEIVVCSEQDKATFANYMAASKIQVVPNGVDNHYFKPDENFSPYPTLLFTGNMNYAPNQEAIRYFTKEIWYRVLEQVPLAKFIIAGRDADKLKPEYTLIKQLEFVDSPEDMRPQYNRAWLVVVPLLSGSGTRLKILEAMAMNKKIISTWVGAEGLKQLVGKQLEIEDDAKAFAEKIVFNLKSRPLVPAENNINAFSWTTITKKMEITL